MQLPFFQTAIKELSLLQTKWKSILDPLLAQPIVQGSVLTNISLTTGVNRINHLLGRKLVGWIVISKSNASTIYDAQASNQNPEETLALVSSGSVVISLEVF